MITDIEENLSVFFGKEITINRIGCTASGAFVESNVANELYLSITLGLQDHILVNVDDGQDVVVGSKVAKTQGQARGIYGQQAGV